MSAVRTLLVGLCLLALAACVSQPQLPHPEQDPADVVDAVRADRRPAPAPAPEPAPQIVIAPPLDDAALALAYFERVRRLAPAELAREVEVMKATFGRTHADADRLRLAMLIALPNTPSADDARAIELLEPLVKAPAHVLHPVAVLLSTYVQEQRRLAQNAQSLQKEVQTLQQKLDALRSLERALSEREGAIPRRR